MRWTPLWARRRQLKCQCVLQIYRSLIHHNLFVTSKLENYNDDQLCKMKKKKDASNSLIFM